MSAAGSAGASTAPKASRLAGPVAHQRTFELPRRATHVAVHWPGHPGAHVSVAFRRDGGFGRWHPVSLDEIGMARPGNETYGTIMVAPNTRRVRGRSCG